MQKNITTLTFIFREWKFLLFGALVMFWSSPGQTYLISLFADEMRADFDLTHLQLGSLYTIATLVSASILWPAGMLVDRLPLARFVWWISAIMALSTSAVTLVSGPATLFLGILVVRFLGQGMMSHIAVTAMARRYVAERGRAIAIAGFGFPIAEGILPPIITIGLTIFHWKSIWTAMGLAVGLTLLPTIPFLLKRTANQDGEGAKHVDYRQAYFRHWTRAEMLRDPRFFMIAPLVMTMSAIFTGLIFHQKFIIGTAKNWDFLWWSFCFVIFAACQVVGSFLSGWLVDRISARYITPYVLLPFGFSLIILGWAENELWSLAILSTMGLSAGATNPVFSSLWAELYGTDHLGGIRAVGAVLSVFASALGPVIVGWGLDRNVSIMTLTSFSILIVFATSSLSAIALKKA